MARGKTFCLLCMWVMLSMTKGGRDNQGKEFILMFLENRVSGSANDMELFITTMSNIDANVNITLPLHSSSWIQTAVVQRTQIVKMEIPSAVRMVGTAKENFGVWVQADREVIVFGVNKEQYSTDAYQGLPVDVLGQDYYVITYEKEALIGVVATEDSTSVSVEFPSTGTISVTYGSSSYTNGDTLTFSLDRFQTFQIFDSGSSSDFTGAHVTSDKPIGVFCGNKKVKVQTPSVSSASSDHLTEQVPPVEALGKKFYTYSTPERSRGDIIRIVAVESSTTVTLSSGGQQTLNAGEFHEFVQNTGDYTIIDSDKGILVGLFAPTHDGNSDGPNGGDPYLTFLLPRPQWAADYTYSTVRTPSNTVFTNQIVVHIDPADKDGLRLDLNNLTTVTWSSITGTSNMEVGVIDVSDGSHNIFHIDPTKTFSAISTGVAQYNSYAFATGTRMALINAPCTPTSTVPGDIVDNDCDGMIDEETLNSIDDDGDGQIDEDLAFPPRVEGNWGSWTSWTNCSETCEAIGNQTRTRNCDNPAPANNGQDCIGVGNELQNCDMTQIDCLLDGNWTAWTTWDNCTGTCGTGTKFRERNCTNPVPKGGGQFCPGAANETATCSLSACPVAAAAASSSDILPSAIGAAVGGLAAIAATAACCCLLYPIARKKIFGDDEEEEEELEDDGIESIGLDGPAGGPGSPPAGTGADRVFPAVSV